MSYPDASYLDQRLFNNGTRPYIKTGSTNYTIPFSFPASVHYYFFYRGVVKIPTSNSTKNYDLIIQNDCTGVLINRRTVLTSASCIIDSLSFSPSGNNNDTIDITKDNIPNFQDWNSNYEIYFRISSDILDNYLKDIYPTELLAVNDIIVVSKFKPYLTII